MNLTAALAIDGWMSDHELWWLAEKAKTAKVIVEAGCWRGRSTRALADNTDGVIYAVDTWNGSPLEAETHRDTKLCAGDGVFLQFCSNLWPHIQSGRVRPLRMNSRNAAVLLTVLLPLAGLPDLIFIDGAHDYESVSADIAGFSRLLADGGVLAGHDYSTAWPDVMRAVHELPGFTQRSGSIWEAD